MLLVSITSLRQGRGQRIPNIPIDIGSELTRAGHPTAAGAGARGPAAAGIGIIDLTGRIAPNAAVHVVAVVAAGQTANLAADDSLIARTDSRQDIALQGLSLIHI